MDLQNQMKQAVAQAAVDQIQNGMILGLGSGSTAALMIEALALKIKSGEIKDVVGVTTSFQGEVLASDLGIPLKSLSSVSTNDSSSIILSLFKVLSNIFLELLVNSLLLKFL